MKLIISPQVIDDLRDIKTYISEELCNPTAASRTVNKIRETYKKLKDAPYIGTSLNAVIDIETDYRYLVSGNYLIFHKVVNDEIRIERVLYGRRNYLQLLFGNSAYTDNDPE